MPATIRSDASTASPGTVNFNALAPASIQVGDLLCAWVAIAPQEGAGGTAVAGFTQILKVTNSNVTLAYFEREADASDVGALTYQVTTGGSSGRARAIYIAAVAGAARPSLQSQGTTSSANPTLPASADLGATPVDTLLLRAAGSQNLTGWGEPAGHAEEADLIGGLTGQRPHLAAYSISLVGATGVQPAAVLTGGTVFNTNVAFTVALKAAPEGGGEIIDAAVAALSGESDVIASGRLIVAGSAALDGESAVTATGRLLQAGGAQLSSESDLASLASMLLAGAGDLSAEGSVAGRGATLLHGAGALSAESALEASGQVLFNGGGALSAETDLAGRGFVLLAGRGALSGLGSVEGRGSLLIVAAVAELSAESDIEGFGEIIAELIAVCALLQIERLARPRLDFLPLAVPSLLAEQITDPKLGAECC